MASVTLSESANLSLNELVAGVIENIITVNPIFEVMPFDGIEGNALAYNREGTLGNAVESGIGTQLTDGNAKAATTFSPVTSNLTTIVGDAEVNGLVQATRSGEGNDQTAVQVAAKAKRVARRYQQLMIIGSVNVSNQFDGLDRLATAAQTLTHTTPAGVALSYIKLDEGIDAVVDKDGEVDYCLMPARTIRSYFALARGLGGASIFETSTLPSGRQLPSYRSIPIFRNDWIPINVVHVSGTATTGSVYMGTFDDGSRMHGIAGLTARDAAGIQVVPVGEAEQYDHFITRIKWYCGLALFSEKGLVQILGLNN